MVDMTKHLTAYAMHNPYVGVYCVVGIALACWASVCECVLCGLFRNGTFNSSSNYFKL